jgi:thymidylate synthase (FAD)
MYVTCNARLLMSILSMRTKDIRATVPPLPQREIEMVAEQMEALWATQML